MTAAASCYHRTRPNRPRRRRRAQSRRHRIVMRRAIARQPWRGIAGSTAGSVVAAGDGGGHPEAEAATPWPLLLSSSITASASASASAAASATTSASTAVSGQQRPRPRRLPRLLGRLGDGFGLDGLARCPPPLRRGLGLDRFGCLGHDLGLDGLVERSGSRFRGPGVGAVSTSASTLRLGRLPRLSSTASTTASTTSRACSTLHQPRSATASASAASAGSGPTTSACDRLGHSLGLDRLGRSLAHQPGPHPARRSADAPVRRQRRGCCRCRPRAPGWPATRS